MIGYNFIKIFVFIALLYFEGFLWANVCKLYYCDWFVWIIGCSILAIINIAIVSYMEKKGMINLPFKSLDVPVFGGRK